MTHPIDLAKIIATAWAAERERYEFAYAKDGEVCLARPPDFVAITGTKAACQTHLDQLCATAVLTAIREVGMSIIDREQFKFWVDGGDDYADIPLAAAPPLGER